MFSCQSKNGGTEAIPIADCFAIRQKERTDPPFLWRTLAMTLLMISFSFFLFSQKIQAEEPTYKRIVSLGPAVTEAIYLLGADDRLIANTIYCDRPAGGKGKEKIGNVVEVNVEKIVSLKPDLVFSTPLTNPQASRKLKEFGIRVVEIPPGKNFEEICDIFLKLGKIAGKEKKADAIVEKARAEVDRLQKSVEAAPKPAVFFQLGAKPLVTVTDDSFMNDYLKYGGGVNIASGARNAGYSREKVVVSNPDVIIIVSMGPSDENEKEIWEKTAGLKAAEDHRIYVVSSTPLCSPTPVSFVQGLEEMIRLLHPELT